MCGCERRLRSKDVEKKKRRGRSGCLESSGYFSRVLGELIEISIRRQSHMNTDQDHLLEG